MNFTVVKSTGIESVGSINPIKVYPIPAKDRLTVDLGVAGQGSVTLYTIDGKTVIKRIVEGKSPIDVSGLTPGIYILQVVIAEHSYRKTIVIGK
jgi:hypothetical protein